MSLIDTATLILTPNGYKEGKLYSVIPANGNGDFSVTRATTATRTNSAGLIEVVPYNLVLYSEQFNKADWTKSASSVTANTTTAPDGTLTADKLVESTATSTTHSANQAYTLASGSVATFSVYVKASERSWIRLTINTASGANASAYFNVSSGTVGTIGGGTASIEVASNGFYRCTISGTLTIANPTLSILLASADNTQVYTGDGTSGLFIWGAQLVEGTSALEYQKTETRLNIPRLDYSLGSCPNLLLEPQRTNLNSFSEEFNNSTFWLRGTGVVVNANTSTSPSGTLTADTITGATGPFVWTGAGTFFRSYAALSSSTAYTFSTYLKGTGSVTITWRDGTTGGNNSLVCNLTTSWQRFEITRTTGATSTGMAIIFSNASGNFDAWGGQMELGAYATSYIPTTTASVTRNADSISLGNVYTNGLISASGGTWFVELRNNLAFVRDTFTSGISLLTTSGADGFYIVVAGPSATYLGIRKRISNVETALTLFTTPTVKVAVKWNGTTADVFVNGVKVVTATAFPATLLQLINGNGGDVPKNINQMALWATPLTDGECSMLTSGIYTPALAYAQLGLTSESPACLDSSVNSLL